MALRRTTLLAFLASITAGAALAGGACGDSVPSDQGGTAGSGTSSSGSTVTTSSTTAAMTSSSSGTGGAGTGGGGTGGTGGASDCYPDPTTYLEIINACTSAQKVDVNPVLPLLEPDGGLPPLP